MTAGAVLLTIFMPLIALIVALIMRGSETNPVKRAFLRTWAWASAAVLAVSLLIGIVVVASVARPAQGAARRGRRFSNESGLFRL